MKQAVIVYTELPGTGNALGGLRPYFSLEQCAGLHEAILRDISEVVSNSLADVFVFYNDGEEEEVELLKSIFPTAECLPKKGVTFEGRIYDAFARVFGMGYRRVILMEGCMPNFDGTEINRAFDLLTKNDLVFGPLDDGSYWLIGAKFDNDIKSMQPIFSVDFESDHILEDTIDIIPRWKTYALLDEKNSVANEGDLLVLRDLDIGRCTGAFLEKNHVLSVIVPVNNNVKDLETTLNQIFKIRGRAEIIFADGYGDNCETIKDAINKQINCMYIKTPASRGAAINAAVEAANGDVLLFLEPGCELCDNPVDEIMKVMDYSEAGCFDVEYRNGGLAMWYNKRLLKKLLSRGIVTKDQGLFLTRDMYFEVGMLDENADMEDIAISHALTQRGVSIKMTKSKIYPSMSGYTGGFFAKLKKVREENVKRELYIRTLAPRQITG